MTFPLPLTPFEEYTLRDGTPSHPMEFFYRLSFDGPLDRAAAAAAADAALRRHPLLGARVAQRPDRRPAFLPARNAAAVDTLVAHDADELPEIPALDTGAGPLVRLLLVDRPHGAGEIVAQFHHVACDGLGALAFLADFCACLGRTPGGEPLPTVESDPRGLRRRGRCGLDSWRLLRSLPAQARGLEGVWKFMRHNPVRLAPLGDSPGAGGLNRLQRAHADFPAAEARRLRRAANAARVSLNELAATALLQALQASIPERALAGPRDVIRLSIPINLRRPADRRLPAANVVSMVFLDRNAAAIAAADLAASLHAEMQLIKRLGLGMTFLFTLAAARLLPGGVGGLVADRSTAATALFTNLGRIFTRGRSAEGGAGLLRAGSRRLVAFEPLAPLRRGTTVAMAAAEYAGTLRFTLRTDPAAIDGPGTTALRDAFACRLRRHLATVTDTHQDGGEAFASPAVVEACA